MSDTSHRAHARVDRRYGHSRTAELVAGGFLLALMVVMFSFVKPQAAQEADTLADWEYYADFSEDMPQVSTAERIGLVTAGADAKDVLEVLGASTDDADRAVRALKATGKIVRNRIAVGTPLTAYFDEAAQDGAGQLVSVSMRADTRTTLLATRQPDGTFHATALTARVFTGSRRVSGTVDTTLEAALVAQGASAEYAAELAALFPDDAQLALGGRPGERFDIVFEVAEDERGNVLENGNLLFAAYNGEQSNGSWYRFTPSDTGRTEFYRLDGSTDEPLLTRYPVGFTQINSGFGRRTHPVTGRLHLHSGVDFRAPPGTPIYAAGDGVISRMGWSEGYGHQVRIKHKRGFMTVYAHMSAYNEDLSPGMTVKRGDIVGYVGESGTATGPHLHFEVRRDGKFLNPMTLDLPSGRSLAGSPEQLNSFRQVVAQIDKARGAMGPLATAQLTRLGVPVNP